MHLQHTQKMAPICTLESKKNVSQSILENVANWQAMQKSACKQQNEPNLNEADANGSQNDVDPVSDRNHDASTPNFASMVTGTLEPSIANRKDNNILLMLGQHSTLKNSDCQAVADRIHEILLLNHLQQLTVEGILDHVIQSNG